MLDPFTQISQVLLNALRADSGWSSIVKPGNVIDMTAQSFEQFKGQLQAGDVPEAILLQDAFVMRAFGSNSRVAELEQDFQLILSHDSLRARPANALKFATLVALAKAGATLGLDGLVRQWEITQGRDDIQGPRVWQRGRQRWISILAIRVAMYVPRETLVSLP